MSSKKPNIINQVFPFETISFTKSQDSKPGMRLPECNVPIQVPSKFISEKYLRKSKVRLPQLSEPEVVRHFTRLSLMNYQIDVGIYPLGSCTMKHNPRLNEDVARDPNVSLMHPLMPAELCQGHLQIMYELQNDLAEITALPAVSLQPAAGAQGEYTALRVAQAYFKKLGETHRNVILTTDSAHGTNPATAAQCGFEVIEVPTNDQGFVTLESVKEKINDRVAVFMVTNPNTLGHFENEIHTIAKLIHDNGALIYCDGANLNAILGVTKPGVFGADMMHINLHKTFSTPHGGGGPGSGPVCCREFLEPFLPTPAVRYVQGKYVLENRGSHSIGKVKSFYGNFGMFIRAWTYIRSHGPKGLREIAENSVLNANYIKARLKDLYPEAYAGPTLHESVLTDKKIKNFGMTTADVGKCLADYAIHAPTVYFPLIVKGALMIEPTESESLEELDRFVDAMCDIYAQSEAGHFKDRSFPENTPRRKIDETRAARQPDLVWKGNL